MQLDSHKHFNFPIFPIPNQWHILCEFSAASILTQYGMDTVTYRKIFAFQKFVCKILFSCQGVEKCVCSAAVVMVQVQFALTNNLMRINIVYIVSCYRINLILVRAIFYKYYFCVLNKSLTSKCQLEFYREHGPLKYQLFKMSLVENNVCRFCQEEEEMENLICECVLLLEREFYFWRKNYTLSNLIHFSLQNNDEISLQTLTQKKKKTKFGSGNLYFEYYPNF